MRSDVIAIDNLGRGFDLALEETRKAAQFRSLGRKQSLLLRLCAEEMLSLARSVTGEMRASFWLESEGPRFELHLSTKTVMNREKREQLITSATSGKNEAAQTFLGKVRDAFEAAMAADPAPGSEIPDEILSDLANHPIGSTEWDAYEQSILKKAADQVRVGIRGGMVDMTVVKTF